MKKISLYIKLLIILPILSINLLFLSCNETKEELSLKEEKKKAEAEKKILIRVWDYARNKEAAEWEQAAIKKFEEMHPECKIHFTKIAWTEGRRKILVTANSNDPPDVVGGGFMYQLLNSNIYEPIDDFFKDELSDFHPSTLKPFFYKGKHYAVPWYITAYALVLNLDLFKKFNVEPPKDGLWTMEEFKKKLSELTYYPDGKPTGIYGLNFNITEEHYEAWGFFYAEGVKILSDDGKRCLFNSPEAIRAIKNLIDIEQNMKVAYSAKGSVRQEESWRNFFNLRKSAITAQGTWAVSTIRTINKNIEERKTENMKQDTQRGQRIMETIDFQIAMFPTGKNGVPVLASAGVGNFAIFKQKDPVKRKLCFELVKFLTNTENQKIFALAQTQFPTRISVGKLYDEDPVMSRIQPYISEAISHPCHPAWNRIDGIIQKNTQLALMGVLSIEEAVEQAEKEVNRVLRKYKN